MISARQIFGIALAAIALCAACVLSSGEARAEDKRPITFARGADSASLKGDVQGMDRDIYPITAKAGQTLKVSVKNRLKLVLFHIQLPGKAGQYLPGAGEEDDATQWQGTLPVSGTYKIIVGAMRGKDSTYTLDVQITN